MPPNDYRPRIVIDLTEVQAQTLSRILPHGVKKPLFQALVDGIIAIHSEGGYEAIGAIVSKQISVQQITDLSLGLTKKEKIAELKSQLYKLGESCE